MILVISEDSDRSTSNVIEWLLHLNASFLRINETDAIEDLSVENEKFSFSVNGIECSSEDIKAVWYRRGWLHLKIEQLLFNPEGDPASRLLADFQQQETRRLLEYLYFLLDSWPNSVGSYQRSDVNKLQALRLARKAGLYTPDTIISSDIKKLRDFLLQYPSVITKPVNEVVATSEALPVTTYTAEVVRTDIADSGRIFPSLLQNNIEKKYELRIFYLKGTFYAMAIFSQNDMQTATDFRRYNLTKPNRRVPYKLPVDIQDKLRCFMNLIQLDTGSIDMLVDHAGKHYFLEVNPVGQYGMTSHPCNYHLDRLIAYSLTNTPI